MSRNKGEEAVIVVFNLKFFGGILIESNYKGVILRILDIFIGN